MKTIDELKMGETLLERVYKLSDGSFSIILRELRETDNINLAAISNSTDSRFNQSQAKPLFASLRVNSPIELLEVYGINVEKLVFDQKDNKGNDYALVGIANPHATYKGKKFRLVVQTNDSLEAKIGKQTFLVKKFNAGTENESIPTKGGKPIYTRKTIVPEGQRNDVIIHRDGQMTSAEYEAYLQNIPAIEEESMTP